MILIISLLSIITIYTINTIFTIITIITIFTIFTIFTILISPISLVSQKRQFYCKVAVKNSTPKSQRSLNELSQFNNKIVKIVIGLFFPFRFLRLNIVNGNWGKLPGSLF